MKVKLNTSLYLSLFLSCIIPTVSAANRITQIQLTPHNNFWRIIIDSRQQASFHQFGLIKPYRLVLDFKGSTIRPSVVKRFKANGPIKKMRYARHGHDSRLVFDLTGNWPVNSYQLHTGFKNAYRVGIDIHTSTQVRRHNKQAINTIKAPQSQRRLKPVAPIAAKLEKPVLAKAVKPIPTLSISQPKARNIVVIIDPGHGGKDPGATGVRGRHEKNVVLKIAQKLQWYLNRQKGFTAKLTRTGDYYLTLRQRLSLARKLKGDVFVSVHADAYNNKSARGVSVFALSQRGATSEAARWLAERENRSELMGGVSLANKGNILRSVLIDLSQTATIGASLRMGQQLLQNLTRVAQLHHSSVEQAAFVVLKSPDIPSLLVETGFMSSRRESALLATNRYQAKIAYSIMQGIKQYFIQHPPRGTLLAALEKNDFRYYVRPGDSLGLLAKHFRVSLRQLATANSLSLRSRLDVGQLLLIPKKHI